MVTYFETTTLNSVKQFNFTCNKFATQAYDINLNVATALSHSICEEGR